MKLPYPIKRKKSWFSDKPIKKYMEEINKQSWDETKRITLMEIYHDDHLNQELKDDLKQKIMKKFNKESWEL